MAGNKRNSRTTFPRKQARRQRAADRFYIRGDMQSNAVYMANKTREAEVLGLVPPYFVRSRG